tara:strand:- start:1495 stop:1671 length:177 start_codon:yes stop_codon:yes gene_type:complete
MVLEGVFIYLKIFISKWNKIKISCVNQPFRFVTKNYIFYEIKQKNKFICAHFNAGVLV